MRAGRVTPIPRPGCPAGDGTDSGKATVFVVVMTAAFLLCLGLVVDGGGLLRTQTRAHTLAQEAARAGVQQIDWQAYRAGAAQVDLDPVAAGAAARAFLADANTSGTVSVDGNIVTVTSTVEYDFTLLPLGTTQVRETATAEPYSEPAP